jgi:FMN-dependent oxidoreductase (nitrilotriacetate monooxygenase family)
MSKNKEAILFWMPIWDGYHLGAWRAEDAPSDSTMNFAEIRAKVQAAERAKFHACFIADSLVVGVEGGQLSDAALSRTGKGVLFEPMTLMSALSMCTERIGLVCTGNTTYNEPFTLARQFASLDHLSGGRSGWNVVTGAGPKESKNFGREQHMAHETRYARGQEFFDATTGLWDSWEDDAWVLDKESGIYFDPAKLHTLNYRGEHLSVAGPLSVSRPVQGHPVIAQAGSSPVGRAFAARVADVVYTIQIDIKSAQEFYASLKDEVAANGRNPDHVKILPALDLMVGRSQAHAEEKLARLDSLVDPKVGLERLSAYLEFDLSDVPLDGPLPEIPETEFGAKTRQKHFLTVAERDNLTVRELMHFAMRFGAIAGTATTIADMIQEWVESGASDGVNITFSDASDSMEIFIDEVIPELQRRGVFHEDYRGSTLRENLGIPRPSNRFAA